MCLLHKNAIKRWEVTEIHFKVESPPLRVSVLLIVVWLFISVDYLCLVTV